jgi:salicylate hydroxylase
MFRIAIIGGGIGGLFTALSIHSHCESKDVQIDIYEQATEYGEIGAGVGIGPNAAKLIEKLGLMDEALKIAGDRNGVWLTLRRYDTGSEVLTVKGPTQGNRTQLPMHRAEFLEILVQAIQNRGAATMHTNKRCQRIEVPLSLATCFRNIQLILLQDRGDMMLVTFADGTTVSPHLVIGADGIHSAVRSHYVVCLRYICER